MKRLTLLLIVAIAGCGTKAPRPEDMSAKAHEKEARREEDKASALETSALLAEPGEPGGVAQWGRSAALKQHAEAHREAADELREEEAEACAGESPESRKSCPLMEFTVRDVQLTPLGVRVTFDGAKADSLLRHANCHAAHAATVARKGMLDCPLYQKDLRIQTEPANGGAVLVLESDSEKTRAELTEIYASVP